MRRLNEKMWAALEESRRGKLRRVHDTEHGKPPWPAHPATLHALVRRGLLSLSGRKSKRGHWVDEWQITEDGRTVLNPPPVVRRESTRSLRVPGGSTRMMQCGVWIDRRTPEPEPVASTDIDAAWFGAALDRHRAAQDRREAARRIARLRKVA